MESNFERLVACFENVFPALDRAAIPTASHDSCAAWDSVANVTLLTLVAEEFGFDLDFEEFEDATSFAAVLEVVNAKTAGA